MLLFWWGGGGVNHIWDKRLKTKGKTFWLQNANVGENMCCYSSLCNVDRSPCCVAQRIVRRKTRYLHKYSQTGGYLAAWKWSCLVIVLAESIGNKKVLISNTYIVIYSFYLLLFIIYYTFDFCADVVKGKSVAIHLCHQMRDIQRSESLIFNWWPCDIVL